MGESIIDNTTTRRRIEDALRKTATEEDLRKIARLLNVEVAYLSKIPDGCSICAPNRPNFGPKQVRFLCQLEVGKRYGEVDACFCGKIIAFVMLEKPRYNLGNKDWWVKIKRDGEKHDHDLSLRDHNIFPYGNGEWGKEHIVFLDDEDYGGSHCYAPYGCGWCPRPNLQHS